MRVIAAHNGPTGWQNFVTKRPTHQHKPRNATAEAALDEQFDAQFVAQLLLLLLPLYTQGAT